MFCICTKKARYDDRHPKSKEAAVSNMEKDPDDWVSGEEPMTERRCPT